MVDSVFFLFYSLSSTLMGLLAIAFFLGCYCGAKIQARHDKITKLERIYRK